MHVKRLPLVSVPRPCPVSWDTMRGGDKARLCAECSRHVYDLATMSTDEAETLLDGGERVCVKLSRGPDGQPVASGIPAATLATLLAVTHANAAEPHGRGGLRGKLTIVNTDDIAGGAEVVATNVETGEEFKTIARDDGRYRLPLPKGRCTVRYAEGGFFP